MDPKTIAWDKPLFRPESAEWIAWCAETPTLSCVRVERYAITRHSRRDTSAEMPVFADASPRDYEMTIYVVTTNSVSITASKLLISKSRVATITANTTTP